MTHYNRSYKGMDRKQADEKAINDIWEWMSGTYHDKAITLYGDLVQLAVHIEYELPMRGKDGTPHVLKFNSLNMTFGMAGISGYPFHAFCRRYCPNKYREWMTSGPDAVELNDEGFALEQGEL